MRIEMKREAELQKRKGQTWKTIVAIVWLILSFVGAYFLTNWLIAQDYLELAYIYQNLRVPGTISETILTLGISFVIFIAIQFVVLIFMAIFSPQAKRKSGVPRADTDDPDPYEKSIRY